MIRKLLLFLIIFVLPASAFAVPLSGEYSITSSATMVGSDWQFTYNITNNDQIAYDETSGTAYFSGLDGFLVMVPEIGTLVSVTVPPPYWGPPGFWSYGLTDTPLSFLTEEVPTLPDGYTWLKFWGNEPISTYWIGSTATFSFTMGGVTVGENPGVMVSYVPLETSTWYRVFDTLIVSPVGAVPEPATMLLLCSGLAGLIGLRRKFGA